jgi:tetratricopeptide (TPR) repeat protein
MDHPSSPSEDSQAIDARGTQGSINQPSGGLGQVFGDKIAGDKVAGDKVAGDKIVTGGGDYVVYNITTTIVSEAQVKTIEDLPPEPGDPPFQGLQYFDESDAERFFGREELTARIVGRLGRAPFLAVIGASGSGKSSVVRAGVIPALRRGARLADGGLPPSDSPKWSMVTFSPTAHPLDALAAALLPEADQVAAMTDLRQGLSLDPGALPRAVSQLLARRKSPHLLLFVDQFEELFTLCRKPDEREAFIASLLAAAPPGESGQLSLLIALRADYYAQVAQNERLREAVSQSQEFIGAMSRAELVRAIDRPLAQGNWQIQQGLIEVILDDIGYEPGALPLLSHALHETWLRRRGRTLTLSGYTEAGGVRGAVAQTAEAVFQRLPEQQQKVARSIFLRMAEVGQDSHDTRRRATYDELITQSTNELVIDAVIGVLTDARLVTTDTLQPGGEKVVQVAHEALIREWPTLRGWLEEDREGLILHQRLAEAADDWGKMGRDKGMLYRSARLKAAQEWADAHTDALSRLELDFLKASQEVAAEEVAAARRLEIARRNQRIFLGLTTVLVVVVAYLAYTFLIRKTPAVMDGFFNVAIASLPGPATTPSDANSGFVEALYTRMQDELGGSSNVLVWRDSPELQKVNVTIGPVEGDTPEARALSAEQIATRLQANMVIYGSEQIGADGREFLLEFYLAPRQGYDYEDIQGSFDLGCRASLEDRLGSINGISTELKSELGDCANASALIALGLSEAQLGHSVEALEAFLKAGERFTASEVIQYLIGSEYLFLVDRESVLAFVRDDFYNQAEDAFNRSITLNPDFPNAYIGLGTVAYKRARDLRLESDLLDGASVSSPEEFDQTIAYLDQAIDTYRFALEKSADSPNIGLPVESVSRQGVGNGMQLKGQILLEQGHREQALENFKQAIQFLEPTIEPLERAGQRRFLTQTYEYLGSAYLHIGYIAELGQAYADGLSAYQAALKYLDLCIAQAESTQDFIIKTNIVADVCQPNKQYVQEQIARLGGTQ